MTIDVRNGNAIKMEQGLDLVFAAGLLADHGLSGPDQASVFHRRPGRDVDPFQFAAPETSGQLPAVAAVPLAGPLLVAGRDVGRIDNQAGNPLFPELVVNPEAAKSGLVDGAISRSREMPAQVGDQDLYVRRLGKRLMFDGKGGQILNLSPERNANFKDLTPKKEGA